MKSIISIPMYGLAYMIFLLWLLPKFLRKAGKKTKRFFRQEELRYPMDLL